MQMRAILMLLSFAALILLLCATVSMAARHQAAEQQPVSEEPKSSGARDKKMSTTKKSASNAEWDDVEATPHNVSGFGRRFLSDQEQIWTSPAKIRFSDTQWLVPLSGITAGLFVTDADFNRGLSHNPNTISRYNNLSNASVAALIGGAGGMWLFGHAKHSEHWSETGFLAGEAALNSLVVVEGMKYSFGRQRPNEGNGNGQFFQGGVSFPSEHAAAAWSVAGVIAHEYPGTLTKIMVYSLASLVDISRLKAQKHFPSDVVVGTVIGNLVAQNIYSRHHDPGLGGEAWRSISEIFRGDGTYSSANQGSPYVPLDSWIYTALDRLIGMGVIDSGFQGIRPWTRRECARLLSEAEEKFPDTGTANPEVQELLSALVRELRPETETAGGAEASGAFRLESLYSRTEHIAGLPINNGYYFAQSQFNDFGRPFGEGWSSVNGFSAYATWGRWVTYVRGEWQAAPGAPALSLAARETMARVDQVPSTMLPPATTQPSVSQLKLLDSYVGLAFSNWQVTFGKQSLWWGPGDGSPLLFSDNAAPVNMFRINRVSPWKLPSFLGWLGPIRTEFFLGQLAGQELLLSPLGLVGQYGQSYSPQPFIHGQKLSFRPTRDLEFGFFRTTIYGGPGYPFTWHTFFRSLISTSNTPAGEPNKPGKRASGLDFSYRLPGLRNWLTFYADGLAWDQFSPIAYADRSAWRAGLYLSQFPRFHSLDLRVEGVYTDNPLGGKICCGFWYFNDTWKSGYTNEGNVMGSWIGRAGQGAQAWSNYWFGARNRLQFNFRHQKISQEYIPGGGSLTDAGVRGDYWLRPNLGLSASVQYERWLIPVVQANESRNVTVAVGILFQPQKLLKRPSPADAHSGKEGDGEF